VTTTIVLDLELHAKEKNRPSVKKVLILYLAPNNPRSIMLSKSWVDKNVWNLSIQLIDSLK